MRAVWLFLVLALASPALAQERRVDVYDAKSRRTGHLVVEPEAGRVDFYDQKSRRTGYGRVDGEGRLELFDAKSRRVGSGQVK
ncbi:MAG: hypothetical protein AABZ64_05875 [Nitrospinota bacterium]